MTEEFILCLDVGGTEIKVNLLTGDQTGFHADGEKYPSHAEGGVSENIGSL